MNKFEKELIKNGYRKFEVPFFKKYASRYYQKKVKNNIGITKYFIDCYCYDNENKVDYEFELYIESGLYCVKTELYGIAKKEPDLTTIEKQFEEIYKSIIDKLHSGDSND